MSRIFAPTFLGKHTYPNYDKMIEEIENIFNENDDIILDLEFISIKEIDPYFTSVLIEMYNKDFTVRTRSKTYIKKLQDIFRRNVLQYSPILIKEGYYHIKVYKD